MYRAITFIILLVTWLTFSGLFDPFHITLGVIACTLVTWWSSDLLFEDRSIGLADRVRQAGRIPGYLLWLFGQIVVANLHVLRIALSPDIAANIQPQIVRFRSGLRTDFEKFVLAQSITLTPGTVTLRIEGDVFTVHAISQDAADGLAGTMTERVRRVFCID